MGNLLLLFDVFRKSNCVADAAGAKNKSALIAAVVGLIYALMAVGKRYGLELPMLTPDVVQDVAAVVGTLIFLFVTFATSDKVGLLPAKRSDTDGGDAVRTGVQEEPASNSGSSVQAEIDLRGGP